MQIKIKTRNKDKDGFSMEVEELKPIGEMVMSEDKDNAILAKGILSNVIITKEQVDEILKMLEPESTPKEKYLAINILENAKSNPYYVFIISRLFADPRWKLEGSYLRTIDEKYIPEESTFLPDFNEFKDGYKKNIK